MDAQMPLAQVNLKKKVLRLEIYTETELGTTRKELARYYHDIKCLILYLS